MMLPPLGGLRDWQALTGFREMNGKTRWICKGKVVHMVQYNSLHVYASCRKKMECVLVLQWRICFTNVKACVPRMWLLCLVHAWLPHAPEVTRALREEAGGIFWRQRCTLWCVLSLHRRGVHQRGAKGEDSRGELALFFYVCIYLSVYECGFVWPPLCFNHAYILLPSLSSCVLVFSSELLQLSDKTEVNLWFRARMSVQV